MKLLKYILVIVVLFIVVGGLYYFINSPKKTAEGTILPNRRLCEATTYGWLCSRGGYKSHCLEQGGRYGCSPGVPCYEDYNRCVFSTSDSGKVCSDSRQCEGRCLVSRDYVQQNYGPVEYQSVNCKAGKCSGTCSEYPDVGEFEIRGGVINNYTGIVY